MVCLVVLISSQSIFVRTFQRKQKVCLLSCNVNGLRDHDRRAKIINHFIFPKNNMPTPDIFTFQETHSNPMDERTWKRQFGRGSTIIMSHGSNASKGVVLGFSARLNVTVCSQDVDPSGRFVVAHIKIQGEPFTVVALYIPPQFSALEKVDFLQSIMQAVAKGRNSRVILCGDFNLILDPDQDSSRFNISMRKENKRFKAFFDDHELTDIWRVMHPDEKRFTCFGTGSPSRLDLAMVSSPFLTHVQTSHIGISYGSDHSLCMWNFLFNKMIKVMVTGECPIIC